MNGERVTVVKPPVVVGTLNAVPIAGGSALVVAPLLSPLFEQVVLSSVVPNWQGTALVPTFLSLALLGVVLGGGRALYRHLTVEYRITAERVEIISRGLGNRRTVLPRSQIRHVALSAGVLAGHVGGGTVSIAVRGPHTKLEVQLREIGEASHWYEELRTVTGTAPRQTVSRAIAPGMCKLVVYLAVGVGIGGAAVALVALTTAPTVTPSLIMVVFLLLCIAVLSGYHLYIASVAYVIYDDHIERCRRFFGTERSYVDTTEIDDVEHVRGMSERIFGVGTVSLSTRWRDEPFRIRAVDDSVSLYKRFKQTT